MKGLLLIVALAVSLSTSAQRLKVHEGPDSLATEQMAPDLKGHLYESGVSLRRATNYELLSWGLAAASIISFTTTKGQDKNVVGVTCASLAIVSKVLSLSYKYKSGIELQLAAGSISVSF